MQKETLDFIRLLSENDYKSLSAKTLKGAEELGELARVVLPFEGQAGTRHRFAEKVKILEEACDTILCMLSVAYDVGFSDDDIEQMMLHKARYWGELQAREKQAKFPVPFEIHVTVSTQDVATFKAACAEIGVKPIVLDLQDKGGSHVMHDVMTSSVHMGDNPSVYADLTRIVDGLKQRGFSVVREKIETVPWHPAAPSSAHGQLLMPQNSYFESHLAVICDDERKATLSALCSDLGCHLSRNSFKVVSDEQYVIMATHRSYTGTGEDFRSAVSKIRLTLEAAGFDVEKEIVEFALYDTKVSHDLAWTQ